MASPYRPTVLLGFRLRRMELTRSVLTIEQPAPAKTVNGFCNLRISMQNNFHKKKNTEHPHELTVKATAVFTAFETVKEAKAKGGKKKLALEDGKKKLALEDGKKLMSIEIDQNMHYSTTKPTHTEEELEEYSWYFYDQATLAAHVHLRDILKDTVFSSVPMPLSLD